MLYNLLLNTPDVLAYNEYYPFGMLVPNRHASSTAYRYGFNGKEKDDEVKGEGLQIDYGFRIYDPRVSKFLSVDPLAQSFPWYTPYQFAGNKPIAAIDLDGLEEYVAIYVDNDADQCSVDTIKSGDVNLAMESITNLINSGQATVMYASETYTPNDYDIFEAKQFSNGQMNTIFQLKGNEKYSGIDKFGGLMSKFGESADAKLLDWIGKSNLGGYQIYSSSGGFGSGLAAIRTGKDGVGTITINGDVLDALSTLASVKSGGRKLGGPVDKGGQPKSLADAADDIIGAASNATSVVVETNNNNSPNSTNDAAYNATNQTSSDTKAESVVKEPDSIMRDVEQAKISTVSIHGLFISVVKVESKGVKIPNTQRAKDSADAASAAQVNSAKRNVQSANNSK